MTSKLGCICFDCKEEFDYFFNYRQNLIESQIKMNCLSLFPSHPGPKKKRKKVDPNQSTHEESEIALPSSLLENNLISLEPIDIKQEICTTFDAEDYQENVENFENNSSDYFQDDVEKKTPDPSKEKKVKSSGRRRTSIKRHRYRTVFIGTDKVTRNGLSLECDLCGKTSKTRAHLAMHMNINHVLDPQLFKCDICQEEFLTTMRLHYHKKITHEKGVFNCEQCDATFENAMLVRSHVHRVHKRNKFCELCGELFSSKDFFSHMLTKNHKFLYGCRVETCPKRFTTEVRRGEIF